MQKKNLFTISLLFCLPVFAFSQVNVAVDHSSGRAVLEIPLHTVTTRSLSHTISLTYNSNGVKVKDNGASFGQNWSLRAGGEIIREVRGLPDDHISTIGTELRRGWLYDSNVGTNTNAQYVSTGATFPADGSGLNCTNEQTIFNYINGFNHLVDSEPDVFSFSTGEFSGSFVFDNTGQITGIRTYPYQELRIFVNRPTNQPISSFEIVTSSGVRYRFSSIETTYKHATNQVSSFYFNELFQLYKTPLNFISGWKLTTIEAPTGEIITFTYRNASSGGSGTPGPLSVEVAHPTITNNTLPQTQFNWQEDKTFLILTNVSAGNQHVSLESPYNHALGSEALSHIFINYHQGTSSFLTKQIKFNYSAKYSSIDSDWSKRRVFLDRVSFIDDCEVFNIDLKYNGVFNEVPTISLPNHESKEFDIFGYYLPGVVNEIPRLYVYPSLTGIHRISLYQKASQPGEIVIPGSNKIQNTTPLTGIIEEINLSSKAKYKFVFEPHAFFNPITNATSLGAGLRIKQITIHDGISYSNDIFKNYEYLGNDGQTSGRLLTLPTYWILSGCYRDPVTNAVTQFSGLSSLTQAEQWRRLIVRTGKNLNEDAEGDFVSYSRVTEKIGTGQGRTVYEFDVPNVFGASSTTDWNPTYTHIARNSACPSTGFNLPGFYNFPFAPQTPFNFLRSFPTRVSEFAENDPVAVSEKIFTYQDRSISPTTIRGLKYSMIPYGVSGNNTLYYFMYGRYSIFANKVRVISQVTERTRDRKSTNQFIENVTTYNYGSLHTLPVAINTTNSDGSQMIRRMKYAIEYGSPSLATSNKQINMIDTLNLTNRYLSLIEEVNAVVPSGGTERVVSGNLYLYENAGTNSAVLPLPRQVMNLDAGLGISGFTLSSTSGSGSTRNFVRNSNYRLSSTANYFKKTNSTLFPDLIKVEGSQRQFTSIHKDRVSALTVLSALNVEPHEIVYSSFDHDTYYSFDRIGLEFTSGKTPVGIRGFTTGSTSSKMLKKQFRKRASSRYLFSCWYKAPQTNGTHTLRLTIKNTSNTVLQQHTLPFTVTSTNEWYYGELNIDLGAIANTDIIAEVTFTGSYTGTGSIALDEVLLAPVNSDITRNIYNQFGLATLIDNDGRFTFYEFSRGGKLKYVRDHDGNIIQKYSYTSASSQGGNPITFTRPAIVYDGVPYTFIANLNCLDVSTLQWKIEVKNNPGSGTFFNGSDEQEIVFPEFVFTTYVVTLKVTHPSYGTYIYSEEVNVEPRPLNVTLCTEGALYRDLCLDANSSFTSCTGQMYTDPRSTTFNVSVTGCTAATYTYTWQVNVTGFWSNVGNNFPSFTMQNSQSYSVRCLVQSSCGRIGVSQVQTINVQESTPGCPGEMN